MFELISKTPHLDWLLLTKRPSNIERMLDRATSQIKSWPWPNVWLGVTAEDQVHYDQRWPVLRRIRAAVRFISYEPALGPLKIGDRRFVPDWIICGGETGSGARLMKRRWARALRDEWHGAGVAFFMKQMTHKKAIPENLLVRQYPDGS